MAIGIVRALVGTSTATDSRGNTRVLRVGDAVELNEMIQSSAGSTVLVQFDNGGFATVGSNDRLVLDQSVPDPAGTNQTAQGTEQNVEDIQAMIAAGMDPTQVAEATAAGADAGTAGDPGHSGSHSFVVVDQEGARGDVTPGFGTDISASPANTAAAQTAGPRFFINPDAGTGTGTDTPTTPDVPAEPPNDAPAITERSGATLHLKEAGVGTVEQGGKPGWALGDHNHAIAGMPEAGGSFTVSDADGDTLSARLVDSRNNPVADVVTDPVTGVMTLETEYGTLTVTPTVNPDGSVTYEYRFELNGNADSMNEGDFADYEYRVEVSDGHGGTVSEDIHVRIDGTNDAPSIKFDSVHVKEAGDGTTAVGGNDGHVGDDHHRFVVHGNLSAKAGDVDAGDTLTYSVDIKGGDNNLETASTGGNVVTDADGKNVSVPVEVLSGTTENGIQTIVTNYGTFTLNTATGEYTFELNTADGSPANNLAQGEFLNLGFTSTVTDQSGAIANHTVRVTVEGSNDAPVLSRPDAVDVWQGGNEHTVAGQVVGSDADHGAKLAYSFGVDAHGNPVTEIETSCGTVRIDPQTGEYEYTLKPGTTAGDVTDEFTVRVTDEHGAYDEKNVSVNVHPNQTPVIDGDPGDSLALKEAGVGTVGEGGKPGWAPGEHNHVIAGNKEDDSSFTVRDPEGGKLTASLLDKDGIPVAGVQTDDSGKMTLQTEYGILTVTPVGNADGSVTYTYHYELNDTLSDSLDQGDSVHEEFRIQVSDGHNGTLTHLVDITIEGTNDAPTFNGRGQNVQLKEDGVFDGNKPLTEDHKNDGFVHEQNSRPKVGGDLSRYVTDADNDAELTYSVNHFNVNNTAVDSLETTLYTGNNKPVIDAATGKPVPVTVEMTGSPTTDANGIQTVKTNYGTLTVDTGTGHYTFELGGDEVSDKLVNSMAAGEKFSFQFETVVTDEHLAIGKHLLTVVIEGANDAPSFAELIHNDYLGIEQPSIGIDGKWEVEAAEQGRWRGEGGNTNRVSDHSDVVTGSFGASDYDRGDILTFSADFVNGTTSGPNKDALEQGTQGNGLKPTSVDDLTLTAPKVLAEHADKGSDHHTELPAGTYKVFHFDVGDFYLDVNTGKYYFDVRDGNPMIDGMNLGDSHSLIFNVTVTDVHGASSSHEFTINITGRNDRPELTVSDTPLGVTAGSDVHGNLLGDNILSLADDDISDTHTFHIISNPAMNGNNPGDYEGRTDDFASNRFDNYNPVTQLEGKYGVLTIDPDTGDYSYRLYGRGEGHDDAWQLVQNLGKDGVLTDEVFHIGVKDAHNAFDITDIHITVNGIESPSVDPVEGSLVVSEAGLNNPADGSETVVLKLADGYEIVEPTDGQYGQGEYGKLVRNAQGQWEYRLDKAYGHAPDHNSASTAEGADSITIQVKGPNGQIQDVTVKVDIVDDVPTASVSDNIDNTVVAGHDSTDGGKLDFGFGADNGEGKQLTVSVGERTVDITDIASKGSCDIAGQYGTLSLHADGTYTYHANPNIRQGQDSFSISIRDADGDTAQSKIDVNVVSAAGPDGGRIAHVTVSESGLNDVANTSETATIRAPDGYTIVSVEQQDVHSPGTVSQDSEGNWHYTLNAAIDSGQAQGANTVEGADTVRMIVQDEFGNQFQINVKVDIVDDVPHIDVAENGSILTGGQRIYDGSLTIDYGADAHSGEQGGADIRVQVAGSDFCGTFRVNADGSFINDSVDLMMGTNVIGKLELAAGKDGHYEYKFIPASGHENDQVNIELSVRDNDGDTTIGTIVIDPAIPPVQVNHAPEVGNILATVEYANQAVHVDGTDRMIVHELLSHSTYAGVRVDATHDLFTTYVGMSLADAKAQARVIYDWQYSSLVNSADCPKVIWVQGSLPVNGSLKVPAGTIVIVDGDLNINGNPKTAGADIEGILFVKNNFNLNQVRFELQADHTDTALILIQGKVQSNANINAQGTGDLDTSIPTDTEQVLIDLNKTFTDADGDRMTFSVDGRALPEGYTASVTDGVLTVTGKDGVFGHHAVTVTATDDKGASTSVSFDINVSGHLANVTVSPAEHGAASIDTMMLSAMDTGTGAEHVSDVAGREPGVNPSHPDGLEGMIAAADTIGHGTAGHDVLYGEGGHDLIEGDGSGTTAGALAGLVHTDSSFESVPDTSQPMSLEQLKGLSDGLETLEHHNDGNDVLMGGAGNDVLIGMGGNDVLHGGEGHDMLIGGSGDDILVGGKGDDVLEGGPGHDIFRYHQGDLDGVVSGDAISDFHAGNLNPSGGTVDQHADILDLKDLLTGTDKLAGGASDLIDGGYLQFDDIKRNDDGSVTVKLSIDTNGAGGGADFHKVATITMNGVHLGDNPANHAQDLLNQLVQNNEIRI